MLLVVGGGIAALTVPRTLLAGEDGRVREAGVNSEGGDEPYLDMDSAARTLMIWGRRPDQRGRVSSHMPAATLARTQALLAGYRVRGRRMRE